MMAAIEGLLLFFLWDIVCFRQQLEALIEVITMIDNNDVVI